MKDPKTEMNSLKNSTGSLDNRMGRVKVRNRQFCFIILANSNVKNIINMD